MGNRQNSPPPLGVPLFWHIPIWPRFWSSPILAHAHLVVILNVGIDESGGLFGGCFYCTRGIMNRGFPLLETTLKTWLVDRLFHVNIPHANGSEIQLGDPDKKKKKNLHMLKLSNPKTRCIRAREVLTTLSFEAGDSLPFRSAGFHAHLAGR